MTYVECTKAFYRELKQLEPHWKTLYALANALEHDAPSAEAEARWSRWREDLERPGFRVKTGVYPATVTLDGVADLTKEER